MKVFFDARFIRTDFHDGVSRYCTELGNAFARLQPVTFIICDRRQLAFLPPNAEYVQIHSPTSVKEPFTALYLNRYKPDVVFSPLQTMGSLGRRFKLILTLHDMIYYHYRTPPYYLNPFIRVLWRLYHMTYTPQRLTLNGADVVATVSEASKAEITQARLTKRLVVVIPNAPRDLTAFLKKQAKPATAAPRNLVYMGSFMGYKNVETLIVGMKYLPGYTLHLLSKITPERMRQYQAMTPKDAQIVFHKGVSDEEYAEIVTNAAVLVSASRDEGYGLPLAEALAAGVPAVVSDLPIHREVAGKGALYFATNDPEDFATKVRQLDEATTRTALAQAGRKHIAQYSWDKSARLLQKAVKSLGTESQ